MKSEGDGALRKLVFWALAMLAASGAWAQEDYYQIQVGDQLSVSVLEDPNLNQTVLVRPDGRISMPIAGSVRAQGLSPERLADVLQERLKRGFEITPTVNVSLRYIAASGETVDPEDAITIYFLGQINDPGPLVLDEPVTILKALALAGGPSRFADLDEIQIRRMSDPAGADGADDGPEEIIIFNYELIEDGDPAQTNIMLQDGDVVVVPERGLFD